MIFVAATVVLAAALFITQFVSMTKQRSLAGLQADLIHLKDAELQTDLKDKDGEIAKLKDETAKAERDIATAKADAAKANENAAMANERAANANKQAENEKVERLKLEAQIAPRRLTVDEQITIGAACRQFSGKEVRVVSYATDVESAVLAKQIVAALSAGGMLVEDKTATIIPFGSISLGVHVAGKDEELVSSLTLILRSDGNLAVGPPSSSIDQTGVLAAGNPLSPDVAVVLVGAKPIE